MIVLDSVFSGYNSTNIIKDINFNINNGEILFVVGPNGSGKTTLFRSILGILKLNSGSIKIDGVSICDMSKKELSKYISYIPQYHTPVFSYKVIDVVLMGRLGYISAFSQPKDDDFNIALSALNKVNIAHLANKYYNELSGGQRQLVLIARAICQSAKIFVLDEPIANLDYKNQRVMLDIIQELADDGYIIIMSTHSLEYSCNKNNKVLLLNEGNMVAFGKIEDVINSYNLEKVYGIEMDVIKINDRYGNKRIICMPV